MTRFELPPLESPSLLSWFGKQILDGPACDAVVGRWDQSAAVAGRSGAEILPERQVEQVHLPIAADGAPLTPVVEAILDINNAYFRFEVTELAPSDPALLLRYPAGEGRYDTHIDVGQGAWGRKLSFVVQLTPPDAYVGGDLMIGVGPSEEAVPRQQGLLVVFPSYMPHRVTPVESGERFTMVGWLHGPSFR